MAVCPVCQSSYPASVRLCPKDGTVLEHQETTDPRVGTLLEGKYRLEERIGRGGMGTIYRATHVMLGKDVAVKLINTDLEVSPEFVARFQREARSASHIDHPSIAAVYDLGQAADGTLYIAMELVRGASLKEIIRRDGQIAPARVVRLMRQIGGGLAAAHRRGIVHRDLKPQNIMVATDAYGQDEAKLLDFGIAKSFGDAETQLTATGLSLGTPQYMSPEQINGAAVDGRSDLYSLGIILYEMLIGSVPFEDPSTPAVLIKHINEPPPRPSLRRPDLQVPADLEAIALQCLEKDPAKRFQSAEELLAALDGVGRPSAEADAATQPNVVAAAAAAGAAAGKAQSASGDLPGGASLPPPSGLQNLTSAGTPADGPSAATRGHRQSAGSSIVLAVMTLVFVGVVGFAGYFFGYFSGPNGQSEPAIEQTEAATEPGQPSAATTAEEEQAAQTSDPQADSSAASAPPPPPSPRVPREPVVARPEAGGASQSAGGGQASAAARAGTDAAPPAEPPAQTRPAAETATTEPPLPEHPPVRFGCDGPTNVCVAIQAALDQELAKASMPIVIDESKAELLVDGLVVEGARRTEQSFGTTFVVTPYTVTFTGTARRSSERIPMPSPTSFSFDERVGQARLTEQARLMATAIVSRLGTYWAARR